MAKPLDPFIKEMLEKYDIDPRRALWDCHGTWVMYHKYVELLGAKAGVQIDAPRVIECSVEKKFVVIQVAGQLGDGDDAPHAWTFGEAAPYNNKNAYPFAMAEKRAKDRLILKLVGCAGHVYTELDAYEISQDGIQWEAPAVTETPTIGDSNAFRTMLEEAQSLEDLNAFAKEIGASDLPAPSKAALRKVYAKRKKEISNG
jgi:hypothetical protein